ncbi:ABC transporter substrate-binding protein [Streptomyces gamaensis]|uniref:ABC transporter substrate-binding protein n=1 Tax=Streptomyces gamaensis TaxID=1763542 RepID=A0ABW0Z2N6_9ACTN
MTAAADTRRRLLRRLVVLLVTIDLAFGALFAAYWGVSRNSEPVHEKTIPAIQQVTAAEQALRQSYTAATDILRKETASTEGAGEEYRTKYDSAYRSLWGAALITPATGPELGNAADQLGTYASLIEQAARNAGNAPLREAYLSYAGQTLDGIPDGKDGLYAQLHKAQRDQLRALHGQTHFSWLRCLSWTLALALWTALVVLFVSTQLFLRRHFRRRYNTWLLAGTVLLTVAVPLAVVGLEIQGRLSSAGHAVLALYDGQGRLVKPGLDITGARDGTRAGWRAGITNWIPFLAAPLAALVVLGLQPRIDEYRFRHGGSQGATRTPLRQRPRRRLRAWHAAVIALALSVLVYGTVERSGLLGPHEKPMTVLAPWSGTEEKAFRAVLRQFSKDTGAKEPSYEGTTAQRSVLLSRIAGGNPPDIAILSSLGEITDYVGNGPNLLRPLADVLGEDTLRRSGQPWAQSSGHVYAVPVKADLKSIAWYDKDAHPDPGQLPALARDGANWCAGMGDGATSGWPGTDWIEDLLLLHSGKDAYRQWAHGELRWDSDQVRGAWEEFGRIFPPGREDPALRQNYRQGLYDPGQRCELQHQASYVRSTYKKKGANPDFVFTAGLLPGTDSRSTVREASADYVSLFGKSRQAERLLKYLLGPEARRAWIKAATNNGTDIGFRPFFVDDSGLDPPADRVERRINDALHHTRDLCLDASDSMPPRMRAAFHQAVLEYLSRPDSTVLRQILKGLDDLREILRNQFAVLPPVCG